MNTFIKTIASACLLFNIFMIKAQYDITSYAQESMISSNDIVQVNIDKYNNTSDFILSSGVTSQTNWVWKMNELDTIKLPIKLGTMDVSIDTDDTLYLSMITRLNRGGNGFPIEGGEIKIETKYDAYEASDIWISNNDANGDFDDWAATFTHTYRFVENSIDTIIITIPNNVAGTAPVYVAGIWFYIGDNSSSVIANTPTDLFASEGVFITNPVEEEMNIQLNDHNTTLSLYSADGIKVKNFEVNGEATIDFSDIDAGIYILRDDESPSYMKILKK